MFVYWWLNSHEFAQFWYCIIIIMSNYYYYIVNHWENFGFFYDEQTIVCGSSHTSSLPAHPAMSSRFHFASRRPSYFLKIYLALVNYKRYILSSLQYGVRHDAHDIINRAQGIRVISLFSIPFRHAFGESNLERALVWRCRKIANRFSESYTDPKSFKGHWTLIPFEFVRWNVNRWMFHVILFCHSFSGYLERRSVHLPSDSLFLFSHALFPYHS